MLHHFNVFCPDRLNWGWMLIQSTGALCPFTHAAFKNTQTEGLTYKTVALWSIIAWQRTFTVCCKEGDDVGLYSESVLCWLGTTSVQRDAETEAYGTSIRGTSLPCNTLLNPHGDSSNTCQDGVIPQPKNKKEKKLSYFSEKARVHPFVLNCG